MARFCMPFNGDERLIDILLLDYHQHIPSVYGSLRRDGVGGGRVLDGQHLQSLDDLSRIIRKLATRSILFNYVISGPSAMNREFEYEYKNSFLRYVALLQKAGVAILTLGNVSLIELTRAHFPELRVSASVNLRTRTTDDVVYILGLGCDEITLHYDTFKDTPCLKAIRSLTNIDLKLIPNDVFIMACPWHKAHTRMQAAHTRTKDVSTPYFNYYRNKCVNLRHRKPDEVLKAMWIAPASVGYYEALGYDYFKLLDRQASTEWITQALEAYLTGSMSSLERVLGTYGQAATSAIPPDVLSSDGPYETSKLEVIPQIGTISTASQRALSFFVAPNHPQQCGSCTVCASAASQDVAFVPSHTEKALQNNRLWQDRVTQSPFIDALENYERDASYKL